MILIIKENTKKHYLHTDYLRCVQVVFNPFLTLQNSQAVKTLLEDLTDRYGWRLILNLPKLTIDKSTKIIENLKKGKLVEICGKFVKKRKISHY